MRKLLLSTTVAAVMASVSFAGQAAESASLSVSGTIAPSSCDVSLSSATIDLGSINAGTLTADLNVKPVSDVTVNVDCGAPAGVAVQTTDNRAASAMTLADISEQMKTDLNGFTDAHLFGLGTDSEQGKIGTLVMAVSAATADGSANANLLTSSDKAAWTATTLSASSVQPVEKNSYFTLANDANSTAPAAMTKSTYTLMSQLMLKKANLYPAGEEVKLDGNVTFSVVYL